MAAIESIEGGAVQARGLGSARDRARLRERVSAERARVERVLARGPREVERRREPRERMPLAERPSGSMAAPMPLRARAGSAPTSGCGLCGGQDVVEDEVFAAGEGGGLRLGRCRRCDHRWTSPLVARFVPRVRRPESRPEARPEARLEARPGSRLSAFVAGGASVGR